VELTIGSIETPIGNLQVVEHDGRVCASAFEDFWPITEDQLRRRLGDVELTPGPLASRTAIERYFKGDISAIDEIEVDAHGSNFQDAVWGSLRGISAGAPISYSELATRVGRPRAMRAVGNANGANPVCLIVPCHRVIRSDGSIGGYGGGIERKEWLLEHEHRHTSA
jgi:methylated-DNA-[protein]-cysteine S-methyltransferase